MKEEEKVEDTEWIDRSGKWKKDGQHNGHKKTGHKDKQRSTKQYTEN